MKIIYALHAGHVAIKDAQCGALPCAQTLFRNWLNQPLLSTQTFLSYVFLKRQHLKHGKDKNEQKTKKSKCWQCRSP